MRTILWRKPGPVTQRMAPAGRSSQRIASILLVLSSGREEATEKWRKSCVPRKKVEASRARERKKPGGRAAEKGVARGWRERLAGSRRKR
jgi:hypothetical protein